MGGPNDYGQNINTLLELMVWNHLAVRSKPFEPYTIQIRGACGQTEEIRAEILAIQEALRHARAYTRLKYDFDVEAALEMLP